ncbi:hypothetical protein H206_01302 [Candidatus Electrothrix aarhusensis]|uniref:DUF6916 domain-containing protein n=1 Tax=Candidatus Electrothrix aarhusensis TaxID=1859131 RepID=A0A444IVZ6_9BACT|nr:hypothetical protein H206_01302 [Candidatus Electrothrix aarhusensis]
MTMQLNFENLAPLLNEQFVLQTDADRRFDVELVEVKQLPDSNRVQYSWQKDTYTDTRVSRSFALVFRVPRELGIAQKTYEISHPIQGMLGPIFLVPIAEDKEGVYYEAIFT